MAFPALFVAGVVVGAGVVNYIITNKREQEKKLAIMHVIKGEMMIEQGNCAAGETEFQLAYSKSFKDKSVLPSDVAANAVRYYNLYSCCDEDGQLRKNWELHCA